MPFGKQPKEINDYWKRFTSIAASYDGFGPDAVEFNSIDLAKPITFRLVEDNPIRGKAIDSEGRPVQNASIQVKSIRLSLKKDLSDWIAAVEAGEKAETACRHISDRFQPRVLSVPSELRTGQDGTFELRGIGKERLVELVLQSDKLARQEVEVANRKIPKTLRHTGDSDNQTGFGEEFTYTCVPARMIEGVVVDAVTKQPLPGVQVASHHLAKIPFSGYGVIHTTSDDQGRFHLTGFPKGVGNTLKVKPDDILPYFMRGIDVPDPSGLDPIEITIELHRGIWITGRVTDQVTKDPVAGARLYYLPWRSNAFAQTSPEFGENFDFDFDQGRYLTDRNGNYRLVGLPGPAIVSAGLSRNHSDVTSTVVNKAVCFAPDEVRPIVVHHLERKIGCVSQVGPEQIKQGSIQLTLRPCATVTGRLMKDGEPLSDVIVESTVLPGGGFSTQLPSIATDRDGRFTIEVPTGCDYSLIARGDQVANYAMIASKISVSPGETIDLGTLTLGEDSKFVADTADGKSKPSTNT